MGKDVGAGPLWGYPLWGSAVSSVTWWEYLVGQVTCCVIQLWGDEGCWCVKTWTHKAQSVQQWFHLCLEFPQVCSVLSHVHNMNINPWVPWNGQSKGTSDFILHASWSWAQVKKVVLSAAPDVHRIRGGRGIRTLDSVFSHSGFPFLTGWPPPHHHVAVATAWREEGHGPLHPCQGESQGACLGLWVRLPLSFDCGCSLVRMTTTCGLHTRTRRLSRCRWRRGMSSVALTTSASSPTRRY